MASPHASSFICLPFTDDRQVADAYRTYYDVCLVSGIIGAIGASVMLCQVLCGGARESVSSSQRNILANLALADLLADVGVIARSVMYISYWHHHGSGVNDLYPYLTPAIGGIVLEGWVSFWYLATYFWTFFFAVDVYNSKHQARWHLWYSHLITWGYCILLVTISAAALWAFPPYMECTVYPLNIVSHFCCTLGPVVIFMLAIPLFYCSTLMKMEKTIKEGQVLEVRKREKVLAKKKAIVFILVFYICWSVNVIDGVLLIVAHLMNIGGTNSQLYLFLYKPVYIYICWTIEALMNPLQGLFNALVYGNVLRSLKKCLQYLKRRFSSQDVIYSWSGEYIDVDFRTGQGRIEHTNKRRKSV